MTVAVQRFRKTAIPLISLLFLALGVPAASTQQSATTGAAAASSDAQGVNSQVSDQPAKSQAGAGGTPDQAAATLMKGDERLVVTRVQKALKDHRVGDAKFALSADFIPYVLYLAKKPVTRHILSEAEQDRIDKQVGTTLPSTGTSVVSKGSVPWLLGFAAEHGAITQSSANNILTFGGTPVNILKALAAQDYLRSYRVAHNDPFIRWFLNRLSFSLSFNAAQTSPPASSGSTTGAAATPAQTGSLAGFSFRYSLINHRDPRDPRWQDRWLDVTGKGAQPVLSSLLDLVRALSKNPQFQTWQEETRNQIDGSQLTDDQISEIFEKRAQALGELIASGRETQELVEQAAAALSAYGDRRNAVLKDINRTAALAIEYVNTRQSVLQGNNVVVEAGSPSASAADVIPNLSTFNLIYEKGFLGSSQFTANASTTLFDKIPAGTSAGRVRDYRVGIQTDTPLPTMQNVGSPTLTFAGLFLSLLEQPLGQDVIVNDTPVSRTGNIALFQSKLTIKVKGGGVKIPIALTYSNRTELIKEQDVAGSIGVTFDVDSLFAK